MILLQLFPYLLLLLIVWVISISTNIRKASFILISLLAFFVGCRYSVGWDYWNYTSLIQNADYGLERFEWIPRQLGFFAHEIKFPQLYFLVVGFFSMFFSIKALKRLSDDFPISIYIFLTFPLFFLTSLVIDRFFLALSIMVYCSTFLIKEKKIVPFFIGLFIAFNIHVASLFAILFIIPCFVHVSNKVNIVFFAFSFVLNSIVIDLFIPNLSLLIGASDVFSSNAESFVKYAETGSSSGMNKIPIVFYTINVINLLCYKQLFPTNDERLNIYLSIFNIGCCLMQLFSFEQNMASRFSVFFLLYICLIVPYYKRVKNYRCIFYLLGLALYIYALTVNASHPDFVGRRNCYLPYNFFFFN